MDDPDISMACPQCGDRFSFPREGIGQSAPCPHCGTTVKLVEKKIGTSKLLKKQRFAGGAEGRLETAGLLIAFANAAGGIIAIVAGCMDTPLNKLLIAFGVAGFFGGILVGVVCFGLAELIRLLKIQNGLDYAGRVAPVEFEQTVWCCAKCNAFLSSNETQCPKCGATLVAEEK